MSQIFREAEINYSYEPDEYTSIFPLRYQWFHFLTGKTGISPIYCKQKDLFKLMDRWNQDPRWKYRTINC